MLCYDWRSEVVVGAKAKKSPAPSVDDGDLL